MTRFMVSTIMGAFFIGLGHYCHDHAAWWEFLPYGIAGLVQTISWNPKGPQ